MKLKCGVSFFENNNLQFSRQCGTTQMQHIIKHSPFDSFIHCKSVICER